MEQNNKFTKNHTLAVKGIAIVFLLCYHCFSRKFRLSGVDVNFFPLSRELGMQISKSMLICVGMFAFLSVYGMTLSMKKRFENYEFTSKEGTLYVIRRYIVVLSMFLLPFIFCGVITAAKGVHKYGDGPVERVGSMLLDLFGVGGIYGTKLMVDTWWYMGFLVMVTIFMPLVMKCYKHFGWLMIPMCLIPGQMVLNNNNNVTKWLLVVPIAVCFADMQVLERIRSASIVKNPNLNLVLKFLISTVILALLLLLRSSYWGLKYMQFTLNGAVPTAFICWCYLFILEIPVLKQILIFLGKHSADIFFVHTFIRGVWFRHELYSLQYASLIFVVLLAGSLLISFILDGVRYIIRYDKITGAVVNKVLAWADKAI